MDTVQVDNLIATVKKLQRRHKPSGNDSLGTSRAMYMNTPLGSLFRSPPRRKHRSRPKKGSSAGKARRVFKKGTKQK